ncbi:MAG: hypothetical protein KGJ87_05265 [Planctomycetota bacterium]|nr:hypothetical protein [Planctomycetota bacterium]
MFKKAAAPVVVAGGAVGAMVTNAHAAGVDLTGVTLDTTSVLALAGIVMVAIGSIWGIKKLVKLGNRS